MSMEEVPASKVASVSMRSSVMGWKLCVEPGSLSCASTALMSISAVSSGDAGAVGSGMASSGEGTSGGSAVSIGGMASGEGVAPSGEGVSGEGTAPKGTAAWAGMCEKTSSSPYTASDVT